MNIRSIITIFILLFFVGCTARPIIYLIEEKDPDKYYLSDSIKKVYRKGYIGKSPLIVVDGIEFKYLANVDTIILPIKKKDITQIDFLASKSSQFLYGKHAVDGAVIINTIARGVFTTDTIRQN